jgi:hypothetical protein
MNRQITRLIFIATLSACSGAMHTGCRGESLSDTPNRHNQEKTAITFADDVTFLKRYADVVVLADASGHAQVAVAPQYQGRVMTSTASGADGPSFGWINREVIASRQRQPHMTTLGGEDRFWLGPEGGQYALYFQANMPFDLDHWQVPEPIDWGDWPVVERHVDRLQLEKQMHLVNYAGASFDLKIDRTVKLVKPSELAQHLGLHPNPEVKAVAYESINTMTNTGERAWSKGTGLLSIWILGMYVPSPQTTVVIPFRKGDAQAMGPIVNDAYFGKVSEDRLVADDGILFFKADGKKRGKIGIARPRAVDTIGSYDAAQRVLTIVQYTLPMNVKDYVNSVWQIQDSPYNGDVVNSYNDGPTEPGKPPLGGFYEIETSSPAAELKPGQQVTHIHRTIHLQGPISQLDATARAALGVGLERIVAAFKEWEK